MLVTLKYSQERISYLSLDFSKLGLKIFDLVFIYLVF